MNGIVTDIRIAARSLARRPGFAAIAVLTIALAMGGITAIFTVLKGTLLDPLPFEESDRLVTVDVVSRQGFYISTSIPNYRDWVRSEALARAGAVAGQGMTLTGDGAARVLDSRAVLDDLWGTLGATALRGRLFGPAETEPGAPPVVVLGHAFWMEHFGGEDGAIGRSMTLDGRPYEVIGVLPPGFSFPQPGGEAYIPMGSVPGLPMNDRESSFGTRLFARLAPGATIESAVEDLARISASITQEEGLEAARAEVRGLRDFAVGDLGAALWILFGAVVFVLLIATANVANLTLARGEDRRRDVAVRTALGASRAGVIRGLVIESLLVSLAGGVVGLGIAVAGLRALLPLLPDGAVMPGRIGLDPGVLLFTFAIAVASGLLFGLVPALRVSRPDLTGDLKEGSRGSSSGNRRLRSALVVAEVALSMVLLVGAGLMIRSLQHLQNVDKGFEVDGRLTTRVAAGRDAVADAEAWRAFYREIETRAAALPGVRDAALTLLLPLSNRSWERRILPEGADVVNDEGDSFLYGVVSTGYFETLGIPIVRGRGFEDRDREGVEPVTVVDETMAERYWPGEDPIGKRVVFEFAGDPSDPQPVYRTIVGVAANVRHYELESPSRIQAYIPYLQSGNQWGMDMYVVLRTTVPPDQLVSPLRSELAAIDPDAPMFRTQTFERYLDDSLREDRALGSILATFGALALILAAIGIFGVLSYSVAQRTREIGIRMALGADASAVRRRVAVEGLALAGIGVGIGVVAALGLTRILQGFLFEVSSVDPVVYTVLGAFLLLVTLAATYLPARAATRVDPAVVLRREA